MLKRSSDAQSLRFHSDAVCRSFTCELGSILHLSLRTVCTHTQIITVLFQVLTGLSVCVIVCVCSTSCCGRCPGAKAGCNTKSWELTYWGLSRSGALVQSGWSHVSDITPHVSARQTPSYLPSANKTLPLVYCCKKQAGCSFKNMILLPGFLHLLGW